MAFTCPKIEYPDQEQIKHPLYQLLYTGNYKKKIENEKEVRKILNQKICRRNFGVGTDLYNLCLKQEDVFQETLSDIKAQENFLDSNEYLNKTLDVNSVNTNKIIVYGVVILVVLLILYMIL